MISTMLATVGRVLEAKSTSICACGCSVTLLYFSGIYCYNSYYSLETEDEKFRDQSIPSANESNASIICVSKNSRRKKGEKVAKHGDAKTRMAALLIGLGSHLGNRQGGREMAFKKTMLFLLCLLVLLSAAGCRAPEVVEPVEPEPTEKETAEPEETPEEIPTETAPDEAALLENYLQSTLIPQCGMMETGSWEWSGHNSDSVDVSRINGILSAGIEDLDGDEQSELLLLRLESEGTASEVHLEVYEVGEDGPYVASACHFTTQNFSCNFYATRLSLFLSQDTAGQMCVNLYGNNIMNEDQEVIRIYHYQNESLNQIAANAYWTGGNYWAYWMEQIPLEDHTYELFSNALENGEEWKILKEAYVDDDSYSEQSIATYTQQEAAMYGEYKQMLLDTAGLVRNDRGYIRTEGDISASVADRFDNAQDFIWLADLYGEMGGVVQDAPEMRTKGFEATDYSGLGR